MQYSRLVDADIEYLTSVVGSEHVLVEIRSWKIMPMMN